MDFMTWFPEHLAAALCSLGSDIHGHLQSCGHIKSNPTRLSLWRHVNGRLA